MLRIVFQASVALGLTCSCVATAQQQMDQDLAAAGFEKLYGVPRLSVYYDPVAQQCVAYSSTGFGIGIDTFACDADDLKQKAQNLGRD